MNQRLFQDAGGTTPAIIAGQPVGLIRPLAGGVDAIQATALSKPTLARWPKGGRRNLANGGFAMGDTSRWPNLATNVGFAATKIWSGMIDGVPTARYSISGTGTVNSSVTLNQVTSTFIPVSVGQSVSFKSRVRVVKGIDQLPSSTDGMRVDNIGRNASNIGAAGDSTSSARYTLGEWTDLSATRTYNNPETVVASGSVVFCFTANQVYDDVQVEVQGCQIEYGLIPTGYQFNYGPNDITEPSVVDLWHLYNDGGDSLNVTLPAGTYGLASIDINRAITVTTITSDGTTPINTLRHERQLDVIIRAGAFTSGEETAIRDYWGRVFA